jgi:hypothetical protein
MWTWSANTRAWSAASWWPATGWSVQINEKSKSSSKSQKGTLTCCHIHQFGNLPYSRSTTWTTRIGPSARRRPAANAATRAVPSGRWMENSNFLKIFNTDYFFKNLLFEKTF